MNNKGLVVILSAPSGCGKDTVFHELQKRRSDVVESVSATTRAPRNGEVEGVNYYFVSEKHFKKMIDTGRLLEYTVYNNCYYGTPVDGVKTAVASGKICFLIIEVQGAKRVKELFPDSISIFLIPPSLEILQQRLYNRDKDNDDNIKTRMSIALDELAHKDEYTYKIVNDNLDDCVDEIDKILSKELEKRNS